MSMNYRYLLTLAIQSVFLSPTIFLFPKVSKNRESLKKHKAVFREVRSKWFYFSKVSLVIGSWYTILGTV
jgi:hypothetical protein